MFRIDGPADAALTVALAHGAGAPMDSSFMAYFAEGLARRGYHVARFEFPYMAARRAGGNRRPPDPLPVLIAAWQAVIAAFESERAGGRLVIGGKSLGGRIASMVADAVGVRGLVCLGYPFHPPGKPVLDPAADPRIAHLRGLRTPTLIVQGARDPFGGRDEVAAYRLSSAIEVLWLEDGDHGFVPRKSSGRTAEHNLGEALAAVAAFLADRRIVG